MKTKKKLLFGFITLFLLFVGCNQIRDTETVEYKELTNEDIEKIETISTKIVDDFSKIMNAESFIETTYTKFSVEFSLQVPDIFDFNYVLIISPIIFNRYGYDITQHWESENEKYFASFNKGKIMVSVVFDNSTNVICFEFMIIK